MLRDHAARLVGMCVRNKISRKTPFRKNITHTLCAGVACGAVRIASL